MKIYDYTAYKKLFYQIYIKNAKKNHKTPNKDEVQTELIQGEGRN